MKEDIHSRVDKALQSFDGIERVEANPYLWSKIKTRLQTAETSTLQQVAWRMVMALGVIIIVNLFTLFFAAQPDGNIKNGAEMVATEYSFNLPQAY